MNAPASTSLETLAINCLRGLAIDAVQRANSGHPGMPLGCMPMAYTLWKHHLRHNPQNPTWKNRDRFILSAGHGSMMLYALLFATGYDLSLEDLKQFRQWESKTPGHPENFMTPGVEMATGPLGQGISTAVGMAVAEEFLRASGKPVDHFTYVICSDGDLMEGVTQEACSLAGHWGLGKLICLYDSNEITIDGRTELSFTEDTISKFGAMGWHVQIIDGMDTNQVNHALDEAKRHEKQPSLIVAKTVIGFGSPHKAGTEKSHGSPLGPDEVKLTKQALGLPEDEEFYWPKEVAEFMKAELDSNLGNAEGEFEPLDFTNVTYPSFDRDVSTRVASGQCLNAIAQACPTFIGGSADLSGSVMTSLKDAEHFGLNARTGRTLSFGVREHSMAAITNGITLHGGIRAFSGTFLIFSDYCKPSLRLAALMQCPSLFTFSHDSIGLGEDGPTHQPIEQLMALRMIPNFNMMRPADANETVVCWQAALESKSTPCALVTSRQNLPLITRGDGAKKGAYVVKAAESPEIILVGTGSELQLALRAAELLQEKDIAAQVVSMPSWFLFERQNQSYRAEIFPIGIPVVSIEAGSTFGWAKYADASIGIDHFGASAPAEVLFREFGITAEAMVEKALALLR